MPINFQDFGRKLLDSRWICVEICENRCIDFSDEHITWDTIYLTIS